MLGAASVDVSSDSQEPQLLRYAHDIARLHALQRTYEQQVPASLELGSTNLPPPHVGIASVLFTDIRGFTGIAERHAANPAALLDVLNAHLAVVVRAILSCGGTVEKYLGDGIMATFGARDAQPDHRERAVAAAIGAIGANERLNRRMAEEWGFRMEMGAAVAAGSLLVGRIGPPERWEWGVLGDPINVCARLVNGARPGEVLITQSVFAKLAKNVRADVIGPMFVRGHAAHVSVCRLQVIPRPSPSQ